MGNGVDVIRNAKGRTTDLSTGAAVCIDQEHHETHEGAKFFYKRVLDVVGGGEVVTYFSFTTPDTEQQIHARARFNDAQVEFTVEIFRDPTITAAGTEVDFINTNGFSTNTPNLVAYAGPTVTVDGDLVWQGKVGVGRSSGVSIEFGYEIIAARNTTYLFKLTKKEVTSPAWIDIDFYFYQHTPHK